MNYTRIITSIKSELLNPRHNSWLLSHLRAISVNHLFQTLWFMMMIAALVFLLNIISWLKLWLNQAVDNVQSKLWVYLYIKSIPSQEDRITKQVFEMTKELEDRGMRVEYYSREDAFNSLSRKLPDVVESFDKYGIGNPLPATMYIMFQNSQEYEVLKEIAQKYQPIIVNTLWDNRDEILVKQEQRVVNVINLGNATTIISLWLVLFIIAIIVVFLLFIIRIKFYGFKDVIQVQKLLGASYWQIKWPYLIHIAIILSIGMLVAVVMMWISWLITHNSLVTLFNMWLLDLIGVWIDDVLLGLILQLVGIGVLSIVVGNVFLDRLLKKI